MFRHFKFGIAHCLLAIALVAATISYVQRTCNYETVALLRIHVTAPIVRPGLNAERIDDNEQAYRVRKKKTRDTIGSKANIDAAVASFANDRDRAMAASLLHNIKADYPGDSEILRISTESRLFKVPTTDSRRAIDALINTYLRASVHKSDQLIQPAVIPDTSYRARLVMAVVVPLFVFVVLSVCWAAIRRMPGRVESASPITE